METDNSIERVIQHLRGVAAGQEEGARLPSVRAMMRTLRAGPVTIEAALRRLAQEGLIEARPGQGTFVARPPPAPPARAAADLDWQTLALGPARAAADALAELALVPTPGALALYAGYLPAELQASTLLSAAAGRALRRPGLWDRSAPEGLDALRTWFAAASGAFRAHEITICPGTQSALAAAFRALAAPGDPVLVESPTYPGALAAARAAGLRPVPVPIDAGGLRPDLLAEAFRASGARLLYCQPTYANPTGAVLAPERRGKLLEILRRAQAFAIEDDWARDFPLDTMAAPAPLAASDEGGHVVYVRSLTKCAAPGLRIGAIAARGAALERLRAARLIDDFFVPGLLQETAVQLLATPAWKRHLRGLHAALRARRDALAAAVRAHLGADSLPLLPSGGLHLWVRLPEEVSDVELCERARRADILLSPGRHWFPAEAPASHIRLSFAAIAPEAAQGAIARLASLILKDGAARSFARGSPPPAASHPQERRRRA
ncbi:MAG TPA: PLP-dependent aminotransferase family protein [Acetobacteraceae bacterium]|nr:PLP-dependent aminotransferase family protein [Acetobacteraceae bacterium]